MIRFAVATLLVCPAVVVAGPPTDNPLAKYKLPWADALPWGRVVVVTDFPGDTPDQKLIAAELDLVGKGGGVVYFPAGTYRFKERVILWNGVVLRGADPVGVLDARKDGYDPPTKFEFPRYDPAFTGKGAPIDTAFKGVVLHEPATNANCGLVNVSIDNGHVEFGEGVDHAAGSNRFVVGCVLRNAAVADPAIPDAAIGQHPWQRFTARHHPAISVKAAENALVANNRLPKSGDADFVMKGYVLEGAKKAKVVCDEGVRFDYDNRPGIYLNDFGLGGAGGSPPDGTPETHPWGFRKGLAVLDNYVYCSGRCAVSFTGNGTVCLGNVIRFPKDVWRPTATGKAVTFGSSTNDNRAVQMRGWRWTVEGNDYEVHRNLAYDRKYPINDREGLMHEDHVNSTVLDSRVVNNVGNAYLSIYKTGGVDGLVVRGNAFRTPGGIAAIYVVADRNKGRFPCRNVTIEGNTTAGGGIEVAGDPGSNNVVRNNTHDGPGGTIRNAAGATLEANKGYAEKK